MGASLYRSIAEITDDGVALREILDAHRLWVLSEQLQGKQAQMMRSDFTNCDLYGVFLKNALLRWSNFESANLSEADLSGADLGEANLRGALIYRADLRYADLTNATLGDADLRWAELHGSDLCASDLQKANLTSADLHSANLNHANLSGAILFGTRFNGTDVCLANLTGASCGYTTFADCDLSNSIGLETVRHNGPSSIGVDTIIKSQGRIPDSFLKGAGVPDIWIEYAKSLVENPIEFYSCFISHSHEDQDFCDRLYADLQTKSVRCWYFPEDATWGKSVWGEIDRSIRVYDKLVVVCSEHSLQSPAVIREIERALQREDGEKKEILFPIRIDDYLFGKWDHPRKADVIAKVVGDFRGWMDHEQYKKNFDKLLKALNRPPAEKS